MIYFNLVLKCDKSSTFQYSYEVGIRPCILVCTGADLLARSTLA
jgi:hypothetical protein